MPSAGLAVLLRIVVTAAALVLAFVGFLQAYPTPPGGRAALDYLEFAYRSVQLALGQFPSELRGKPVPLTLQIARFALPLAAAWVTLSLGWMQSRNRVRSQLMRRRGDHLIVYGDGPLAEGLVKGERAGKGRTISWVEDAGGRLARDVEQLGGVHVDGARGALELKQLGLETARAFVAASESDAANMEVARRVLDYALEHRKPGDPLQIIARIDDVALQGALEARLTRQEQRDRVELRLASAPQLLARQFLLEHPIDRFMSSPEAPIRLCWIGWSPLAEAMLVRVLASAHYNDAVRLDLRVADLSGDRAEAAFFSRRPGARDIAPLRFETLKDDAPSLIAEQLAESSASEPFNALYIMGADPSRALSTGLAIEAAFARRGLTSPPLYAYLPEGDAGAKTLVDDSILQPCGTLASLADPEVLLQEKHDEIARSIHEFYLEGRLSDGEAIGDRATLLEWPNLPEAVRDENRLVADCYLFKLRGIDAAIVEGTEPQIRFTGQEVEMLAEAEHRRWVAGRLLNGWSHNPVRNDALKQHPDIVPYAALSERIRDLDREQIRMIPRILSAVNKRAVRNLRVALATSTGDARQEDVRAALATLARDYPDRRLVVLGDPDEAGERSVLLAAAGLGYAVDLLVRRPAQAVIADVPAAERTALGQLFRTADRLAASTASAGASSTLAAEITVPLDRGPAAAPRRTQSAAAAS